MLIRNAKIDGVTAGLRIAGGRVAAIGALDHEGGEPVIDAAGAALLPGLHDHHIHIAAFVASLASVACGPPAVTTRDELAAALRRPGTGWLRGVGYHDSVAASLDRTLLDELVPHRPCRIQHRGGRMWFLNSAAIDMLLADRPAPFDDRCMNG